MRHFPPVTAAVLDLGCGPGTYLQHFGRGSLGLDVDPEPAGALGLDARKWNFTDPIPEDLKRRFDAVWCSNLLEHALAPHQLLIRSRRALKPDGLLLVTVPVTNRFRSRAWHGFLAADHINFFTAKTLKHTVERAGYRISFLGSASFPAFPRLLAQIARPFAPNVLCVAALDSDFRYPEKAQKLLVDDEVTWKTPRTHADRSIE